MLREEGKNVKLGKRLKRLTEPWKTLGEENKTATPMPWTQQGNREACSSRQRLHAKRSLLNNFKIESFSHAAATSMLVLCL